MTATDTGVRIAPLRPEHAGQVLAIYQLGIDEGNANFETTAPTWVGFGSAKLPDHRLVALDDGRPAAVTEGRGIGVVVPHRVVAVLVEAGTGCRGRGPQSLPERTPCARRAGPPGGRSTEADGHVRPATRPPPAADAGHLPARRTQPHGAGAEEREAARQQPVPEPPAWLVERGIGAGQLPVRVHTGHCRDTGGRCIPAAPHQARQLLSEGVTACIPCRPDTALGVLE